MENLKNIAPIEDFNWDAYENGDATTTVSKEDLEKAYDSMHIFRSEIFAGNKHEVTPASYAIHLCAHSWKNSLLDKLLLFIKKLKKA